MRLKYCILSWWVHNRYEQTSLDTGFRRWRMNLRINLTHHATGLTHKSTLCCSRFLIRKPWSSLKVVIITRKFGVQGRVVHNVRTIHARKRQKAGLTTYRFGDKTNGSRPVQLALNYIINSSSSVAYLKSSGLNSSNSCWANNNL